jgi:manganese/zinc/iron transport system permease protein
MIASIFPGFDVQRCLIDPWANDASVFGWVFVMGFLVAAACGLVGNYLILRRMALMGDAVSHSVLPGLVIAFLLAQSRGTWVMFAGALAAGAATTILVDAIHRRSRVKQDSAIGITFSTLFAIGVVLISGDRHGLLRDHPREARRHPHEHIATPQLVEDPG